MFRYGITLLISMLSLLLATCDVRSRRASSDKNIDLAMGELETILWTTSMNLNACNKNVLLLTINDDDELELFTPPTKAARIKIIVVPAAAGSTTCKIGKYTFEYSQQAYRDVLATTDIGCAVGTCWQYANNRLTAYAINSNVPTASETWIKKSGNKYIYFSIGATVKQTGTVTIKPGSASIIYSTGQIKLQATVQQDSQPKAGASVVYTITCPREDPIVQPAVISNANGLAQTTRAVSSNSNRIDSLDDINLPTCTVSAAIDGGAAIDIISAQPEREKKSGLPLRVTWGVYANMDNCNFTTTHVAIIGLNGDGSLRRIYHTGKPNVGDVNLLFLPVNNNPNASCIIDSTTYRIDPTTFDNTTTAANMECNADNCWQFYDSSITPQPKPCCDHYSPDSSERWIKKTGYKYVFHVVQ